MIRSRDRILTTHVGSLPRGTLLSDLLVRREAGEAVDLSALAVEMDKSVADVVARQRAAAIDIGNDGEQQRVGFQTYVPARMAGFGGASQRPLPRDLKEFPEIAEMQRPVAAVGDRERVIASTDCGFGTFTGREYVASAVVWKRLETLHAGADIASARLWGRKAA